MTNLYCLIKNVTAHLKQQCTLTKCVFIENPVEVPFLYHELFCWASSTLFLIRDITWAGSAAPNTELPATIQFAPAEAAIPMVEGPNPPSTCKIKLKLVYEIQWHKYNELMFQKRMPFSIFHAYAQNQVNVKKLSYRSTKCM